MIDLSNETIVHVKKGPIEYLQFRKLLEYGDKISHCYTLKGNNNNYKEIEKDNYSLLCKDLGLDYEYLTKVKGQAHSSFVEIVEEKKETHEGVDGLITNKNKISLALVFADCTPILFYDPVKNAIGNVHSGWRGTIQKIGQIGAKKMLDTFGCNKENLLCFIGPCIQKCHFEVEEDVKEIFEKTFSYLLSSKEYIVMTEKKEDKQKFFLDTNIINRKLLEEIGIPSKNIIESNICTVCNSDYMHSYRADGNKSGRNTAIIGLKN